MGILDAPAGSRPGSALLGVATTVTANGALTAGQHNPVDATSGNRAMTLADASSGGQQVAVAKTDSTSNTVTVTVAHLRGTGAPGTVTLYGQDETRVLESKADGSWWPIADHLPKSYLSGTYAPLSKGANYVWKWQTGTTYAVNDEAMFPDGTIVKCAVPHTASASYNADLLAGDWLILSSPSTQQGVSVASYGAVIDGSTDDSAAWQAAITAQATLGGRIFQPPGTSVATGLSVTAQAHITLLAGATLLHKAGAAAPLFTMPTGGTSLRFDGPGTIDGNKANQTTRNPLVSAVIAQGDEVIFDRVKLRNFFQGAYVTGFGGLLAMDYCDVAGQAQHDGTAGHSTMILNIQSGQQITSGAKGHIRFNHNHCIGTASPTLAGGSPGGVFFASNGYNLAGGGGPGTTGFADGNGSTMEAVGNYFYGYGQNCGGNDIAPLHFYPASGGARIIGNYMEGCGFSAIAAKSVDNFICTGNVILNGQTSTQNTATEGAISYVPGYQAASTRRTRAVISGNIVLNPGGDASNDQQACINATGTSTSQAHDVTISDNIVAGGGIGIRVTQAQDVKILGNNVTGGTTSSTLADHGIFFSSVTGRVDIRGNKVTVSNGHGLSAITSVNTATFQVTDNEFLSSSASTYACTVRGASFAKFAGNVFNNSASGTAVSFTTDGTNPIGWLAWDASNTIVAGAASFVWASITKATGTLAATGSPVGSVTPGEVGTAYRQTNGSGDSILWIANGLTNTSWVKELQLTSQSVGEPFASLGMIGGNFDPDVAVTAQTAQAAGVLDICRFTLLAGGGVSNVYVGLAALGTGLSNCYFGVYDDSGNLLGQTADISATLSGSTGNKTIPLTATTAGVAVGAAINVALLVGTATTMPQLRGINGTGAPNIGITAVAKNRRASAGSGLSALPATLPTKTAITTNWFCGVS